MASIDDIFKDLNRKGARRYGEQGVSQREHALQAAWLAEREGAAPALIVAALLHDVGHLVHKLGEDPSARGVDDCHERLGAKHLAKWFGEDVCAPVRLHVEAKRYLCHAELDYRNSLSKASKRSLELQGGPFARDAARAFLVRPFAVEAVCLRRWDEAAKVPGKETPGLDHFEAIVERYLEDARPRRPQA